MTFLLLACASSVKYCIDYNKEKTTVVRKCASAMHNGRPNGTEHAYLQVR